MTAPALYQLTGQYQQLAHRLADSDFDLATIEDTIEASGIVDEINRKAQGLVLVARSAAQFIPAIDAEIERLQALKTRNQKAYDGLMVYVKKCMESAEISEIKAPLFTLLIVNNPPAVDILNNVDIPDEYMSEQKPAPPRTPDKKKIGAALKAGADLSWAALSRSTRMKVV